ncbi:MAG: hypothetical protein JW832_07300 [Deltaproteobacteria bacterium]|nr:hypothetical protein [Deltaproteobacteria bacterium]
MKQQPLDIVQECAALFTQENTLAWFDVQLECDGGSTEGLCRIAHPKTAACGRDYVSLVFVVDTPQESQREQVAAVLAGLGNGVLEKALPEIAAVVAVPPSSCGPQLLIRQFDLMLKELFRASPEFIASRLHPALQDAPGLQTGGLGWWEDLRRETPRAAASGPARAQAPRSLITRLKDKLFAG